MAEDILPTLWTPDPHTLAKLRILRGYLEAWMPILSRQAQRRSASEVTYIDAFAGPGEYETGEPGSPLVAVAVANSHTQDFPVPVRMWFVEKRADRYAHLAELLGPSIRNPPRNGIVETPILGDADTETRRVLCPPGSYSPTLVFLDQFGYSAVAMSLIAEILSRQSHEVFSFINWRELNRWVEDKTKWSGIDRAFGGREWKQILELQGTEKSNKFIELYESALRDRGRVKFRCTFAMHGTDNQLLYWLVFASNNLRGLEEMKKAMWRMDATGSFRFSDKHSGQLGLLSGFDQEWLADHLADRLTGMVMTIAKVKLFVLRETPCYLFVNALRRLEREGRLRVRGAPDSRRMGTFGKYVDKPSVTLKFV